VSRPAPRVGGRQSLPYKCRRPPSRVRDSNPVPFVGSGRRAISPGFLGETTCPVPSRDRPGPADQRRRFLSPRLGPRAKGTGLLRARLLNTYPVPPDFGRRLRRIFDFGLAQSQSPPPARTETLAHRSASSIQPQKLDSAKISFSEFRVATRQEAAVERWATSAAIELLEQPLAASQPGQRVVPATRRAECGSHFVSAFTPLSRPSLMASINFRSSSRSGVSFAS
jgi:hypothetical protein